MTGIYPYSIMTSTFSPIINSKKAIKISFSAQEWCGNTFIQLNNREEFDVNFYSYFELIIGEKVLVIKEYGYIPVTNFLVLFNFKTAMLDLFLLSAFTCFMGKKSSVTKIFTAVPL